MRHVIPAALLLAPPRRNRPRGSGARGCLGAGRAGQPPDRFYTSDQFSNTVSVIDPAANKVLGVIRLGDTTPANLSPLYRGQLLVHGMGFSPDRARPCSPSRSARIRSASSTPPPTRCATRPMSAVRRTRRSSRRTVAKLGERAGRGLRRDPRRGHRQGDGPDHGAERAGMTIFSADGRYGYVAPALSPETVAIDVKSREIVGRIKQESPFCPDIAATPDGKQVWFTLKDVGRVQVFEATPPFKALKTIETGPITNHVNIARTKGAVRLRDDRRPEPCEGPSAPTTSRGRDHSNRRAPPRSLALGRWNADLCRPGECRCRRGDRHGPQRGHRHVPDSARGRRASPTFLRRLPEGAGAPNLQPLGARGPIEHAHARRAGRQGRQRKSRCSTRACCRPCKRR